jgi:hypothetical protein
MKKKSSPKLIAMKKNSWDQFLAKLAIFVSILMIVGGAIGMILVQKDLKLSQDLRQQASVDDGKVSVTMTSSNFIVNEQGKITFSINTEGVQTDGVQLTFNVVSDILPTPPTFSLTDDAPLQIAYSEVQDTADGYLISVITLPKQLGQSFSSTTATPFGYLNVAPTSNGTITLNFDVENSLSTVHASNPPKDELTHIATTDFAVGSPAIEVSPSPEVSPDITYCSGDNECQGGYVCAGIPPGGCTDGSACATQPYCRLAEGSSCSSDTNCYLGYECTNGTCSSTTISVSPSPIASPDSSPVATPEVSPDPTDDPGIGGNPDIASCNESCAINADCDVNLRCYSGQCRLVTNVSSNTCSNPTDQGLSFSCNEYCADSNECADGLVCHGNSCRNPENVNSTSCRTLTVAQRSSVVRSCNESCSSNNDCDVNLRCYQGACRLATNPGSYSCSASTKKLVSKSIYGGTTASKGSDDGSSTKTGKTDPNKDKSAVDKTTIDSDKAMQKLPGTDSMDKDGNLMEGDETALDVVKNYFMINPKLPIIFMGIGLGLITAIILLAFLKRNKDDDETPRPPTGGGSQANNGAEKNIQDRINSLKKESIQTQGAGASVPPAMSPPVARMTIPQNPPVKNTTGEVFSNQNKSSSMLDKLKNKDITPPSV